MTALTTAGQSIEEQFPTIDSIVEAARSLIPAVKWDFLSGGAEYETTLRRNRKSWDRIGFQKRCMRDISQRSTATTFLGHDLALPVMLAPVGVVHRFSADGPISTARAAREAGTIMFLSTGAEPSIKEIRDAGIDSPIAYQLYALGDREWITERVRMAEKYGCIAICFTADLSTPGIQDRIKRNQYQINPAGHDYSFRETFTWSDFDWLRSLTSLPLMVKGITHPADARLAVEHGADVVYVSNHGARFLDHQPGSIETLPAMVAAVDEKVPIVFDSGVLRGSDVVKAIAMGASAVSIGKLMMWSVAVGGAPLVARALEILRQEMLSVMGNLGVQSIAELSPEYLCAVEPPLASDWVGFERACDY